MKFPENYREKCTTVFLEKYPLTAIMKRIIVTAQPNLILPELNIPQDRMVGCGLRVRFHPFLLTFFIYHVFHCKAPDLILAPWGEIVYRNQLVNNFL